MSESAERNSRPYTLIPHPELAKEAFAWDDGGRGGFSIAVVSPALGGILACAGGSAQPAIEGFTPTGGHLGSDSLCRVSKSLARPLVGLCGLR